MKNSFLYDFLCDKITINQFKNHINEEVERYKIKLQKKGASVPLSIDEDIKIFFEKNHLIKLLNHYLNDDLTSWELEYIADCFSLNESIIYENEELFDFLERITDSEVSGQISKEKTTRLMNAVLNL